MKKIIFTSLLVLESFLLKAQFNTIGQKMVSGNVGFGADFSKVPSNPVSKNNTANLGLGISYGKFTKPNILQSVTFQTSYFNNKQNVNTNQGIKNSGYSISVGLNKTRMYELGKKLYLGIQQGPSVGYGKSKQQNTIGNITNTTNTNSLNANYNVAPVFYYALKNKLALSLQTNNFLGANFSRNVTKNVGIPNDKTVNWSVGFNGGFWQSPLNNISVGFNYIF